MANNELNVPTSPNDWEAYAKEQNIDFSSSIHDDNHTFSSASNMQESQFLLLRVLWDRPGAQHLPAKMREMFGPTVLETAEQALKDASNWKNYLDHLPTEAARRTATPIDLGHFTQVLWKQLAIADTLAGKNSTDDDQYALGSLTPGSKILSRLRPNKPINYADPSSSSSSSSSPSGSAGNAPAETQSLPESENSNWSTGSEAMNGATVAMIAKDEQLVTTYREALLTALNMDAFPKGLTHHHSIARTTFKFGELFTASVDGTDQDLRGSSIIKAIYEDKRSFRRAKNKAVRQQESGEMVCWIFDDIEQHGVTHPSPSERPIGTKLAAGGETHTRVLISQGRSQLFITLAEYDDRYLAYLRSEKSLQDLEKDSSDRVFMTMREYGPFDIYKKADMQKFGLCYIALLCHWRKSDGNDLPGALRSMKIESTSRGTPVPSSSDDNDSNGSDSPTRRAIERKAQRAKQAGKQ